MDGRQWLAEQDRACSRAGLVSQFPFCIPGSKEATTTLHMLTLLKDLLPCFPEGLVKSCSETLLRVMTLSHVVSSGPKAGERGACSGGIWGTHWSVKMQGLGSPSLTVFLS